MKKNTHDIYYAVHHVLMGIMSIVYPIAVWFYTPLYSFVWYFTIVAVVAEAFFCFKNTLHVYSLYLYVLQWIGLTFHIFVLTHFFGFLSCVQSIQTFAIMYFIFKGKIKTVDDIRNINELLLK